MDSQTNVVGELRYRKLIEIGPFVLLVQAGFYVITENGSDWYYPVNLFDGLSTMHEKAIERGLVVDFNNQVNQLVLAC